MSRHGVLAIRDQYPREIKAAQKRIKAAVERHYYDLKLEAIDLIARKRKLGFSLQLIKVCDALTDKMLALETPIQTHPYPLSIKLAALSRVKRNESSNRSVWHEAKT